MAVLEALSMHLRVNPRRPRHDDAVPGHIRSEHIAGTNEKHCCLSQTSKSQAALYFMLSVNVLTTRRIYGGS
jgi:hypothetical protein